MGNWCCKPPKITVNEPQENKSFQHDDEIYIPKTQASPQHTDLQDSNKKDDLQSSGYSTSHESSYPLSDNSNNLRDGRSQYEESEENRHLSQEHQRIIKRNFRYLKDELDPEFLLDYFIQEELFTEDQADEVKSAGCRRNQVDLFLRFLLTSRRSSSYSQFLDILDQIKCGHIRQRLESKDEGMPFDPQGSTERDIESTRQQLQANRAKICSSIDTSCLAEYFVQYEEFSIDEYELVIHESTRKLKAEKLLDTLLKDSHLQRGYDILNYALQDQGDSILKDLVQEERRRSQKERKPASTGYFSEFQSVDDKERCSTHRFKVASEMRITINSNTDTGQSKRRKEKNFVEKAKKYKIQYDLNDDLVSDTECLITDVDQGSIVLRIQGCKKGAIESLLLLPNGIGVSKILQKVFSHPKLAKFFHQSGTFHVTIDILPSPVEIVTEKPKTLKQIICTNLEFLAEELDALRFLDLDIFTEEEKAYILQSRPTSRAECTKLMLRYICQKNDNDIEKFIHEIKQKKRFVWDQISTQESKECLDDQILSTFYTDFVENLSPFKITPYCVDRGIVDKSLIKRKCYKTRQREKCAKMLMLDIFSKGYDARNEFLHILKAFDQIPSAIQLTSKVSDHVHSNKEITIPGLKFQGIYCLAASEQTELPTALASSTEAWREHAADQGHANEEETLPKLNFLAVSEHTESLKVKENDEDRIEDESGYNSLNSNRRSQALYELESLQESNERRTLQLGNIGEGETMSLDHSAEEHSLTKDESKAHLKHYPALMSRPMTVPRCLPIVYFDQVIYDITTRPRHSRSVLRKDAEDVTEVSVKPSGDRSLGLNSNRHSNCSRHSLQITDLSQNFN